MKKAFLISTSVLALSAGAAFAQTNSSNLYQNGSGNAASIDQTAGATGTNGSDVYQGYYNNGDAATNSTVSVMQIGGNTYSQIIQNDGNQHAAVEQHNSAGGIQNSYIVQSDTTNTGNTATVIQTTSLSSDNQESHVTQSGAGGLVTVTQNGPSDKSTVTQNGNYNNPTDAGSQYTNALGWVAGGVKIIQESGAGNTSTVNQFSSNSGIAVTQDGTTGTNGSEVDQWAGSGNFAGVYQTASASMNNSLVTQTGANNLASVRQH